MAKYDFSEIEKRWQERWEKEKLYRAEDFSKKPKFYCLVEFPYPSGEGLHVGHPRSYTALDVLARKRRMEGWNVLYPMGFDAFGLPTENYAVKTGIHPAVATAENIKVFTAQLKSLGFSFDWDREVVTTDPAYYRWTQWIFVQMWEQGLAYKAKMPINWCPSCKIGLANEEVVGGACERCGAMVEEREKEQWLLRITKYADRLIDDLKLVDYLERIKTQQVNWIGRSEGARISFPVRDTEYEMPVFTTRPDTLFGATYMVLALEHPLIENLKLKIENWGEVEEYIRKAVSKSEEERIAAPTPEGGRGSDSDADFGSERRRRSVGKGDKTGVELKGVKAINPANKEEIPIFVADYVLAGYGTGAIMAVPAHDARDFEFAKKFKLPIVKVIEPTPLVSVPQSAQDAIAGMGGRGGNIRILADLWEGEGTLVNSGKFNGMDSEGAKWAITDFVYGKREAQYHLRDWIFSRQRYWGEPIPMVHCEACALRDPAGQGWVPVPEDGLPVLLPEVEKYEPTDTGESPLAAIAGWVNTKCPACGGPAERETDTMPNWAGSNWYFLRYIDPKNEEALADKKKLVYWMPVDWYNGGMEHTTLHLLYSRFVFKFLYDIGAVPKECGPEPYRKRTAHGMILGESGEKMSKSRGNVVNPNEMVARFGADAFRVYEMFMGPFDQAIAWSTDGLVGAHRFLARLHRLFAGAEPAAVEVPKPLVRLLHRTIKKVSEDIEGFRFNTAVSALMILLNGMEKNQQSLNLSILQSFLRLLAPFAPHLAEELWHQLGGKNSIHREKWPSFDAKLVEAETFPLVVQVDGKHRGTVFAPTGVTEGEARELALQEPKVGAILKGKKVARVVFVPGRLVNFVTER